MRARFTHKSRTCIGTPEGKRQFNRELFTSIAGEYAWMKQVLSLGRDSAWKRTMVESLSPRRRPVCVDLACGTGELGRLLTSRFPDATVVGVDLTEAMLREARRDAGPGQSFLQADMAATGLPAGAYDVVTVGYGLRNAAELDAAIAEMVRLLNPGGEAAILDFSRYDGRWAFSIELALLRFWGGLWGLLRSGNPDTYRYIADSLQQFPTRSSLHRMLETAGLRIRNSRRRLGGIIEIVIAVREPV